MDEPRTTEPTIGPVDGKGGLFGRVALSLGLCTPEQLTLAVIAAREPGNAGRRLGELLTEAGVLTADQVQDILSSQSKCIVRCPQCGRQYNVPDAAPDASLSCPACDEQLELPSMLTDAPVDHTLVVGANAADESEDDTVDPDAAPSSDARQSYADLEGSALGPYRIGAMLGEGGMGAVFSAEHRTLRRFTAVKVLPADLSHEKARVRRFMREAEAMAQVEHDNIVRIHNVGSDRGFYFIEMEVVSGGTLLDVINRDAPLAVNRALAIIKACASGLAAAHDRGIIHRDIKPENVLMTEHGDPKIADFGLAKAVEGAADAAAAADLTGDRAVQGTPAYMSPEQCRGDHADARGDVYALGVVLFELLTQKRPFEGAQPLTIILRRLKEEAPSPRKYRPDLPLSLSNVVERMLAKDPEERYQTATEVLEALQAFERGEEIAYTARRIRVRRARIAVTSAVLIALGVGSTLLWQRLNRAEIIKIVNTGETRGDAIQRVEREARAAYLAGDDTAARASFGELGTLAKAHPSLALLESLERRDAARRAWDAGDVALAERMVHEVVSAVPEDTVAADLADRIALLLQARAAIADRDAVAAARAARALARLEPTHAEAGRIEASSRALMRAVAHVGKREWAEALLAADAAEGHGAAPAWVADVFVTLADALSAELHDALSRRDLVAAGRTAALLRERIDRAESAAAAVAAFDAAKQRFDRDWNAGERHLEAREGVEAAQRFQAAATISNDPRLPERLRDAQVWALLRTAQSLAERREYARAIATALKAREGAADSAPIDVALDRYRRALADLRAREAGTRLEAGDFVEAGRLAAAALAVDPGHAAATGVAAEVDRHTRTPAGFVYIPAGESALPDGRGGTRRQRVAAFYVSGTEVTNAQFKAFIDDGGYDNDAHWSGLPKDARQGFLDESGQPGPAEWNGGTFPAGAEHWPVVGVSGAEADAYAAWAGARLPTESEWLTAAGYDADADTFRRFPWGDAWDAERVGADGTPSLAAVGTRTGDRSHWGCFDMAGNAMEWTAELWSAESPHRLILGGSLDPVAAGILDPERGCRLDRRQARADPITARLPGLGFRLAKHVGGGGH